MDKVSAKEQMTEANKLARARKRILEDPFLESTITGRVCLPFQKTRKKDAEKRKGNNALVERRERVDSFLDGLNDFAGEDVRFTRLMFVLFSAN
jgi:hypothetical protein